MSELELDNTNNGGRKTSEVAEKDLYQLLIAEAGE